MAELKLTHNFNAESKRHFLNNQLTVLHCHHYATLFTQLSLDAKDIVDGTRILLESTEDVFYNVLTSYYKENSISDTSDRMEIAVQMFSAIGMGTMVVAASDTKGGEITMPYTYVDEGWLKKWGKNKAPVNFIGAGYVAGMFAAVFDKPTRTYSVTETQSKVMGADESRFKVTG